MSRGVWVLGGTGYVAGEAVRLVQCHPHFNLLGVTSSSQAGAPLSEPFPHLGAWAEKTQFLNLEEASRRATPEDLILAALPHGETDRALGGFPAKCRVVDLSADHRFDSEWLCRPPDLAYSGPAPTKVAHPGCFATAAMLAGAPLVAAGAKKLTCFGVTGSTGSGRTPKVGTHHPDRDGGFWAYQPLTHRHQGEIAKVLGIEDVSFIPHSGPFTRGIHMTVVAESAEADFAGFYSGSPFVRIVDRMPSVKEVSGSNRAVIGVTRSGSETVVVCVIDNLLKGAAGGGVQWLNKMCGFAETAGLEADALGWA